MPCWDLSFSVLPTKSGQKTLRQRCANGKVVSYEFKASVAMGQNLKEQCDILNLKIEDFVFPVVSDSAIEGP